MKNSSQLALAILLILSVSCSNEDAKPDCDGTLSIVVNSTTPSTACNPANGSITVSATGGSAPFQFSLNGGTKQSSGTFSALAGGVYTITVFDANNCEDEIENIEVGDDTTLDLTATPSADSECLTNNGTITLSGSGGAGPYTYKIDGGAFSTQTNYSNLEPDTYNATVKDANGCEVTKAVTVQRANTNISFAGIIKPIITANCATSASCHAAGVTSRPDLSENSVIKDKASLIKSLTASGAMPKNGTLSGNEKKQIACWVDDGAPINN